MLSFRTFGYIFGLGYSLRRENCYRLGRNGYLREHLVIVEDLVIVTDNMHHIKLSDIRVSEVLGAGRVCMLVWDNKRDS